MEIVKIWKVAAQNTQSFIKEMRKKGIRQDGYATLINHFAGFNFWYETDESFGDITENTAEQISLVHNVEIQRFSINGL